jgi:hypothetical protein
MKRAAAVTGSSNATVCSSSSSLGCSSLQLGLSLSSSWQC